MKDYGTLSQAINKLKEEGYIHDFNLLEERLEIKAEKKQYGIDEFEVDKLLRFEGMSDPGDNSILYAITASDGKKGLLDDAYGVYAGQVSRDLIKKLNRPTP